MPVFAGLETFATGRLVAERLVPGHFEELRKIDTHPQVMATMGGVRTEAVTRGYLERNLAHWDEWGFGAYLFRDRASGAWAGRGCVRRLAIEGTVDLEIGYAFYPEYWGKGYATEIALGCADLAFTRIGVPSVVAITTPANTGSQAVMRKAGMGYERDFMLDGVPHVVFRKVRA